MRIVRALVVGFTLFSASAANAQARPSTASIRKAVFALEEEWTRALIKVDTAAFRRITDPAFVYTEDDVMMNQRELIHAIVTGDKVDWSTNEGMQLHDHFPVAIVTGVLVTKGHSKKGSFTNRYRFTDTWLYRDGKWRAIAAQDYLIPARK